MNFDVLENILDSAWIFNSKRELVYFNGATASLLDVSPKRIKKGKKIFEYLKFEDENTFFMPDGDEGKNKELKLTEIPFKTFKGKEGIGLVAIRKLMQEKSDEELWLCLVRDITLEVNLHTKYHEKLREMEEANKRLEKYNRDLEKMVEERTIDLKKANDFLEAMVNSLGQGLVVFDRDLKCNPLYTRICNTLFFDTPENNEITDVLGIQNRESFKQWTNILFKKMIPFNDAIQLGPKAVENNGRHVSLEYHSINDEDGVTGIVVVGTDKTEEKLAKDELDIKTSFVKMVTSVLHNKKQFYIFYKEFKKGMSYFNEIRKNKFTGFCESELKIVLHSLKGGSMVFSMMELADKLHEIEGYLANTSVRAPDEMELYFKELDKIFGTSFDQVFELLGERLDASENDVRFIRLEDLEKFRNFLIKCKANKLAESFNDEFIKEPLFTFFQGYNGLLNNMAVEMNKKVAPIEVLNEKLKIDTRQFDEFFNALPHLFRNCIYHGIENPEKRKEKMKDEEGHIKINFDVNYEENELVITISDDGAGIDLDKLKDKLIHHGYENVSNLDAGSLALKIFEPDISTSETVNKVSGRGVGMHALKVAVDKLNGRLEVKTEKDIGTEFKFLLPLVA